jgi:hypothetical protein
MWQILLVKVEGSSGGKSKWKSKVWLPALNQLSVSETLGGQQKFLESLSFSPFIFLPLFIIQTETQRWFLSLACVSLS